MDANTNKPRLLPESKARVSIRAALARAPLLADLDLEALSSGGESVVRSLPLWVRQFGWLEGHGQYCLWCDPRRGKADTFPSQIILGLGPGQYFIDVLDVGSASWMARESAAGGPLVAGLPYTGHPLVVWIRRTGVPSGRPPEDP